MYARVSRYHGDSDRLMEGFRHTVEPLEQMEGFVQAYFLIDPETSRAVTVTLWRDEAAMTASAEWASSAREHATHDSNATIVSVETYKVALTAESAAAR